MSSPRGLEEGGMGEMGTEELRFVVVRFGEGERRLGVGGGAGGGVLGLGLVWGEMGDGRGNRNEKGLKGSLERSGGCRTLRNMLKFRSERLA